jgi:hypothetical protein
VARHVITDDARAAARRLVLSMTAAGAEVGELVSAMAPLHVRHDLFPGDELVALAADALDESGASRENPIEGSGIRERLLPEHPFSGSTAHAKSRYALHAVAMTSAGVEPDLLEDAGWYRADDFWLYALYGFVIYVRAAAEHAGITVAEVCSRIATRNGIALETS